MNIHLKRCKKCRRWFDVGTNFDICPECRMKKKKGGEDGKNNMSKVW